MFNAAGDGKESNKKKLTTLFVYRFPIPHILRNGVLSIIYELLPLFISHKKTKHYERAVYRLGILTCNNTAMHSRIATRCPPLHTLRTRIGTLLNNVHYNFVKLRRAIDHYYSDKFLSSTSAHNLINQTRPSFLARVRAFSS